MNRSLLCLVTAPLLASCATDSYGNSDVGTRTSVGVALGGALGALAGHAVGVDPVTGAAAGMVVGGATGYATARAGTKQDRQYYRDTQGYCYYVDAGGVPHYDDPPVRC